MYPSSYVLGRFGWMCLFAGLASVIWCLAPESIGGSKDVLAGAIPAISLLFTAGMILGVLPETRIIFRKKMSNAASAAFPGVVLRGFKDSSSGV